MKNSKIAAKRLLSLVVALLGLTANPQSPIGKPVGPALTQPGQNGRGRERAAIENMPLHFIENRGQVDANAAYYIQGRDKSIYFATQGLTFAITDNSGTRDRWALKLDFIDANPNVKLKAREQT